ncbi:hypothetical protein P171DRAFT_482080 [Karstenula rhodostoma CBS 690.94]|uniref:P-loop containing nucleoside triphosphate hydrolase protein n=1 Tax=Karstenula rhodostoma CBS 690.94 TaxID=1392251 RepID=A0A9P4UFZ4_9PLEO|nr:hypothetical protein P171DRAFT_482080 [Karstenula rhodostoma CBS 690.94]
MSRPYLSFVILGESGVGKTSFADKVIHDTQYYLYDPFDDAPTRLKLPVGTDTHDILIKDISLTPIRARESGFVAEVFDQALRNADGIVLMYDITSEESYKNVTGFGWDYVWACRAPKNAGGQKYPTGHVRFGCTLVGNKADLVQGDDREKRQVPKGLAEEWASMVGVNAFESDRFDKGVLEAVLCDLVKSTHRAQRRDKEDIEEVEERREAKREAEQQAAQPIEETKQKSKTSSTLSKLKGILPRKGSSSNTKA